MYLLVRDSKLFMFEVLRKRVNCMIFILNQDVMKNYSYFFDHLLTVFLLRNDTSYHYFFLIYNQLPKLLFAIFDVCDFYEEYHHRLPNRYIFFYLNNLNYTKILNSFLVSTNKKMPRSWNIKLFEL